MFFRQAMQIWKVSFREIAKIFIISGGIMLFISILIRYVFGETILTIFGFSEKVSVWDGSGPPPIYHGIPGASVVRFQGMLEGPNQMAFFLLVYMGTYISLLFRFKKYRFINGVILFFLLFLLTQTYSRSGLMGCVVGCGVLF
ncbi:hypothetical protein H6768_01520 [Candidatus Peribacteria bacterium]|nr:hypothetical protein [Candidatus Peribacteria bacterium]